MEDNSTTSQPVEQIDVEEQAKSLTAYKAAVGIAVYYPPVFFAVGVFGNIAAFLVMMMKHNRSISCCVYIAYLALCDLGHVVVSFCFYLKWRIQLFGSSSSNLECKFTVWAAGFCTITSCFFLVLMTVDRYVAVCHPHRFHSFRTPKTALRVGAGVLGVMVVYTMPYLYTGVLVDGYCTVDRPGMLSTLYFTISTILGSVVPFSILIVLNASIARAVWKRNKNVAAQNNAGSANNNQATGKKGEKQLIVMLFLVCGAFFVLIIPMYIRVVLGKSLDFKSSAAAYANFELFHNIAAKSMPTNHAINFFLYILGGKGFRKDAMKLFGLSRKNNVSGSSTSAS